MQPSPAPDIAVVIPTYNRRDVLPRAIDSVLAQRHENFELIVVDDGSQDGTAAYLASISDPRLRWDRFGERRRGNAARNHGAALSRAPILSFLDSDDRYLPDRLGSALAFFAASPEVDLRLSSYTLVTGSRSTPCVNPEAIFTREEFERYLIGYCLYLGGSGITMRRGAFERIGGFDVTVSRMQDRELLVRAARFYGCASTAGIDWEKTRSEDSVSHQPAGQLAAFLALCERNPIVREKYPELFRYLVAREIVTPLVKLRFREAGSALRELRDSRQAGMPALQVPFDYLRGKRLRRAMRDEIFRRYGARMG